MGIVSDAYMQLVASTGAPTMVLLSCGVALGLASYVMRPAKTNGKAPPVIPSKIPFLGNVVEFGQRPIAFLHEAYSQYGGVFSFKMFGRYCTYLVGNEASELFFTSTNDQLNAEDVYANLTVPVFGKGVAYDVPNKLFCEQKRIMKIGLTLERLKHYGHLIQDEARVYFQRWDNEGEVNLFEAFSEVIIHTAARCLLGKELRSILDESIAHVYADLDKGFTPEAWLLPAWLPLPSFRRRDRAHQQMHKIFIAAIEKRRASGDVEEDMLQTLLDANYKEGSKLSSSEVAGMLIGLLLAGQHTSSTTGSWLGFFLAKHGDIQKACRDSCASARGGEDTTIEYDQLMEMHELDRVLKETLRLRPPIMTMMRNAREDQHIMGYTIPKGHYVCVSPPVNHILQSDWIDPLDFNPDRFISRANDKFSYVPFGAGRHKCIGEQFAYVQIKTVWAELLSTFEFELVGTDIPETDFTTLIHVPKNPIIRYRRRTPV